MNPVLIIIIFLAATALWFLLSSLYRPLGRFMYGIWKEAVDAMEDEEKSENNEENGGNE